MELTFSYSLEVSLVSTLYLLEHTSKMQRGLEACVVLVASFAMEKQNMGGAHKKCHHENMTFLLDESVTMLNW